MENIFNQILNLSIAFVLALVFLTLSTKLSKIVLGISLSQEIKKDNKSAAIIYFGLMVMLGLIIGLFKL